MVPLIISILCLLCIIFVTVYLILRDNWIKSQFDKDMLELTRQINKANMSKYKYDIQQSSNVNSLAMAFSNARNDFVTKQSIADGIVSKSIRTSNLTYYIMNSADWNSNAIEKFTDKTDSPKIVSLGSDMLVPNLAVNNLTADTISGSKGRIYSVETDNLNATNMLVQNASVAKNLTAQNGWFPSIVSDNGKFKMIVAQQANADNIRATNMLVNNIQIESTGKFGAPLMSAFDAPLALMSVSNVRTNSLTSMNLQATNIVGGSGNFTSNVYARSGTFASNLCIEDACLTKEAIKKLNMIPSPTPTIPLQQVTAIPMPPTVATQPKLSPPATMTPVTMTPTTTPAAPTIIPTTPAATPSPVTLSSGR